MIQQQCPLVLKMSLCNAYKSPYIRKAPTPPRDEDILYWFSLRCVYFRNRNNNRICLRTTRTRELPCKNCICSITRRTYSSRKLNRDKVTLSSCTFLFRSIDNKLSC